MPIPFLLYALIGVAAFAVIANWGEIKKVLSNFIPKMIEVLKTRGLRGVGILVCQKAAELKAHILHKTYYREHGKLFEETLTREIPESELPPYVLAKLGPQEVDITNDYETNENLSLSLG